MDVNTLFALNVLSDLSNCVKESDKVDLLEQKHVVLSLRRKCANVQCEN